jgi:hypothetical protein
MVYVYSFNSESKSSILYKEFSSCSEAALYLDCSNATISGYLDKNKLYKKNNGCYRRRGLLRKNTRVHKLLLIITSNYSREINIL